MLDILAAIILAASSLADGATPVPSPSVASSSPSSESATVFAVGPHFQTVPVVVFRGFQFADSVEMLVINGDSNAKLDLDCIHVTVTELGKNADLGVTSPTVMNGSPTSSQLVTIVHANLLQPGKYMLNVAWQACLLEAASGEKFEADSWYQPFAVTMWSSAAIFCYTPSAGEHIFSLGYRDAPFPYGAHMLTSVKGVGQDRFRISIVSEEQSDPRSHEVSSPQWFWKTVRVIRDPALREVEAHMRNQTVRAARDIYVECTDESGNRYSLRDSLGGKFRVEGMYRVAASKLVNYRGGKIFAIDPILVSFADFPNVPRNNIDVRTGTESACVHAWAYFLDPDEVVKELDPA